MIRPFYAVPDVARKCATRPPHPEGCSSEALYRCPPGPRCPRGANNPRRLRQRFLVAELREGSSSGRLEDRQVIYRWPGGRGGERRYRAPDRGLRAHAGSQGHRRGSREQPAGGELDWPEVQSGPGFLFLETALGTEAAGSSWRLILHGECLILGQGVEDHLGHRAATGIGGADQKDLLHAFRLRGITSVGAIRTASVPLSVVYRSTDLYYVNRLHRNLRVLRPCLLSGTATRQSCR